jgi:hypothetical protein
MRIISNFKDYYDSVNSFGQDLTLVYTRKESSRYIVEVKGNTALPEYPHIGYLYSDIQYYPMVIGFCGNLYPCVRFEGYTIIYNREEIRDVKRSWYYREDPLESFWNCNTDSSYNVLKGLFNEAPVFTYTHTRKGKEIVLNPKLDRYNFQSIKDPFTAYQEIVQFLGTYVHPDNTKPEPLTEKQYLQKHSMDKTSFRKPKSKKK